MARLRLHNVRVPYGTAAEAVERAAAAKIKRTGMPLAGFHIARRSLDTRERPRICWSFAVEFEGDEQLISHLPANEASVVEKTEEAVVTPGAEPMRARPVVVGAGPAGMFAALVLAEHGYGPLVVERGSQVAARDADVAALMHGRGVNPESNLLFGEGGAGTYSDGKLTTRTSDARMQRVLEVLVECGAPEEILIDARPHIGSDLLPGVVTRLRRRIEGLGGEFRFGARAEGLAIAGDGSATGVEAGGETIAAGAVILAAGTSARGLYETLVRQGVRLEGKGFQVGVRVEHPQEVIDRAIYRKERGDLPAAEYIMSSPPRGDARGMATFCMCPGGIIVPAIAEEGHLSTNGMSNSRRDGRFANAALVATVGAEDLEGSDALAGARFQEGLEEKAFAAGGDYRAPAQRCGDFLAGEVSGELPESTYPLGLVATELRSVLPAFLVKALERALPEFDRKIKGFVSRGLLVAVEARVSSPVRVVRDAATRESVSTRGLYPAGEGSGYAGGIMTSAVDGMKTAEAIVGRFARPGETGKGR